VCAIPLLRCPMNVQATPRHSSAPAGRPFCVDRCADSQQPHPLPFRAATLACCQRSASCTAHRRVGARAFGPAPVVTLVRGAHRQVASSDDVAAAAAHAACSAPSRTLQARAPALAWTRALLAPAASACAKYTRPCCCVRRFALTLRGFCARRHCRGAGGAVAGACALRSPHATHGVYCCRG
jgi:hypothetical protein